MKINSLLFVILSIISFGCNNSESKKVNSPIESFQNSLVANGITGSNVFKVYKDGEILYDNIINSNAVGDKDIDEETIFAIHSMTKTVTTVATMILHEKGSFEFDDPLHNYLPEFKDINCKGPDGIYPCDNELKIIHLLTHRSGYVYYLENGEN